MLAAIVRIHINTDFEGDEAAALSYAKVITGLLNREDDENEDGVCPFSLDRYIDMAYQEPA